MPIQIEEFLKPISPDQPCGSDLRYAPVTDQIREARRQEDEIAQGVWKHEVKTADYPLVIKLARQALAKQGKDLQVAAWLTEALLAREGAPGLQQGAGLILRLLQEYWDTVYPLIEDDGDMDMRATPLRWVASQLDPNLRLIPITASGVTWLRYKDSRKVPTEMETRTSPDKIELRQELLEDGRLSPEDFEKDFENTPVAFYEQLLVEMDGARRSVKDLGAFCDGKLGEDAPDFGPLNTALEEVRQTVQILCVKKGGRIPGQAGEEEVAEVEDAAAAEPAPPDAQEPVPARIAPVEKRRPATAEPQDAHDAIQRMVDLAHYLRRRNIGDPAPYLVLRALRWGELRAAGPYLDPAQAEAPATETRVELKRLYNEGNWEQVIHAAEKAMAEPCGRAWLDLQRYVVRACRNSGQSAAAAAVCSALKSLLADYPQLPDGTLTDDTPAANAETKDWLREENLVPANEPPPPPAAQPEPPPPQPAWSMPAPAPEPPPMESPDGAIDTYQLAMEAARFGRVDEAISLLLDEIHQEHSGRGRFLRRSQLVQICIATGNHAIALPILQELAAEINQRRLEEWESPEVLSQPLGMLYGCLQNAGGAEADKQQLYARICRLDPLRALNLPR